MPSPQPSPAQSHPAADLTGSTIGRYSVRALLGSGGQGEVYCADDLSLQRTVALKRLSPALRSDERYRQRFLREAQRASGLNDPHIAGIYDVLEHQGELLLVMEYVEGVSLRQRLREPVELADVLKFACQCCEALIAAHQSGVVHRDIKPENIMLTPTGRVKVLDFGVAKRLPSEDEAEALESTETKAGEISGTPAYMAPELLLGRPSDERADIFSLGVVFYELLTGRHPFLVQGVVATVDRILHQEPRSITQQNPTVPLAWERLVCKMLAKDPAQRYASAQELLNDLNTLPTVAAPVRPAVVRWFDRHRTAVAVTAALVLALLGLTAAWQHWRPKPQIFAERDWVLIADPENTTGQPIFNDSLREALTIALQQSQYVNVLPRSRVFEALQRMKRSGVARIDENLGRELCQRENVRVLLASSIRSSGEALQITVRALRPDSGDLLFAESEQLRQRDEFFDRVDALAKRVRNNLGESSPRVEASSKPLEKVTTRSLEALQLYSQATDATAKGNMEQVPALLQSALQLDPDFAMAHARLGWHYAWIVGKNDRALSELQKGYDLRQGVTEREQYWIEGIYYGLHEQYDKAAESLRLLVNLYPDDAEAHRELATAYYSLGQLEKAISELHEALRLNPFSTPASANLVLYLAQHNQPAQAVDAFREAGKRGIDAPYLHWGLGLAYLGQDKLAEARQEFQRLSRQDTYHGLGELYLARVTLYEGRLHAATGELVSAIGGDGKSPAGGLQTVNRYLLGRTYLILGKPQFARQQASMVLAAPETDLQTIDLISAGQLYADSDATLLAKRVLRRLDRVRQARPSSWNNSAFHILEAEIALAEGKPQKAVELFSVADQEYSQFLSTLGLARAYEVQQDWANAARQWEKVLLAKGEILQNGFPADLGMAHLRLARSYRRLNDFQRARIHYERFLQFWNNADDLPIRRQAMQELRDLSNSQTISYARPNE